MIQFKKSHKEYKVYGHQEEFIGIIRNGGFEDFVFVADNVNDQWSGGTLRIISDFLYNLNQGGILNPDNLTVARNGRVIHGEYSLNVKVADHD